MSTPAKALRNIAIIAHVDHGKTTLVDKLLVQAGTFAKHQHVGERMMDSNDLERERGITILAKNCSIRYDDAQINIVDTPGHADFGGEVERVLGMVDGVLLLVDAVEGPMPQTRFVTLKALKLGLAPIVVVNKVDRPGARPEWVVNQTFELFDKLGATEEQLDFPVVYASALNGWATLDVNVAKAQRAAGRRRHAAAVRDDPRARAGAGRRSRRAAAVPGERARLLELRRPPRHRPHPPRPPRAGAGSRGAERSARRGRRSRRRRRSARSSRSPAWSACRSRRREAGDIVLVTGVDDLTIGTTLASIEAPEALPPISVDEPTLSMYFQVNTSPLAGREGKYVTSRNLRDRLAKEVLTNVALRVEETGDTDSFLVSGRGELHLTILIENMRREGYELAVSRPRVVLREIDGVTCEPFEALSVDVEETAPGRGDGSARPAPRRPHATWSPTAAAACGSNTAFRRAG